MVPLLACLIFLGSIAPVSAQGTGLYYQPPKPVTRTIHGMTLLFFEDHHLPTFHATAYLRGGSVYDPLGKEGLASLSMQTIRLGGTEKRPKEIEEWIESVGGELEFGSAPEFLTASLSVLSKDATPGLELLFDLLKHPAMEAEYFENLKKQSIDTLKREGEDSLRYAMREFQPLVYEAGATQPAGLRLWGRRDRVASLQKIRRQDVVNFHQEYFYPNRLILTVTGDFKPDELVKTLEAALTNWAPTAKELPKIPPLEQRMQAGFYLLPKAGLTQTSVVMGHLGEKRDNPDKYPLMVMNFILGGSGALTSRMGDEIRSKAGKAYAVWSLFGFGKDYGVFQTIAQTAAGNSAWVVEKMRELITQMHTQPEILPSELNRAKESILRSFLFSYESKNALLQDLAKFYLWGYPADYLEEFQRHIRAVTKQDVERVARQYLHPEALKVLLVGDPKAVEKSYEGSKEQPKVLKVP